MVAVLVHAHPSRFLAGDTANKIGTYQLAIAAKHHGAAFYVAAPSTSCDVTMPTGDVITIEERPAQELRCVAGVQIAPEAIDVWNPAFDVTPAELITGIITEHGVIYPTAGPGTPFDVASFLAKINKNARSTDEADASEPPAAKKGKV